MTSSWAKTGCDEILIFTDIFPHHELTFKSHFSSRETIFFHCKGYVSNYVLEIKSWKRQNQILVAERYEENNTKKKEQNKTKQKGKHEEWVCFVQMYRLSLFVLQMNFKLMTCSLTRPRGRCWHFSLPKYWAWNMVSFKANLESHISSNYPLKRCNLYRRVLHNMFSSNSRRIQQKQKNRWAHARK